MKAFIIGNGESRSKFNLAKLFKHGLVYGCNAIYRDYRPDFLITVDPIIAKEIGKTEYINLWKVYTPYSDIASTHKNFVSFKTKTRQCAGVTASLLAINHGCTEIYLLGHDLGSPNGLINNVYKNSSCYKQAWQDDDSFDVYVSDYYDLFATQTKIDFIRVMGKQSYPVKQFRNYTNYKETKLETFEKNFS